VPLTTHGGPGLIHPTNLPVVNPPPADPDPVDGHGRTPLCDASVFGLTQVALALLAGGADIDYATPPRHPSFDMCHPYGGFTPLMYAAIENRPGEAVQVDPMKPTLKAHGTKRLKLNFDSLLSNFAFEFNLRRYTPASPSCSSSAEPTALTSLPMRPTGTMRGPLRSTLRVFAPTAALTLLRRSQCSAGDVAARAA
jgi:hypothetical protein